MCNFGQGEKKNSLMRGGIAIIIALLTLCVVLVIFVNPKKIESRNQTKQEVAQVKSKMPEQSKVAEAKQTDEIKVRLIDEEENAIQDAVSGRVATNMEEGALEDETVAQNIMSSYQRVITQAARGVRADGSIFHLLGKRGNCYVITDLDGDAQPELVLCMGDATLEEQCLQVIKYNKEDGQMRIAFTGRPGAEFYKNGIIKQNQDNEREKGQEDLYDIFELNEQDIYTKTVEKDGTGEDQRVQAENKFELSWTRF